MGKFKATKPKHRPKHACSKSTGTGMQCASLTVSESELETVINSDLVLTTRHGSIQNTVKSLIERLQINSLEERQCACQTINVLIGESDESVIDRFLSGHLLRHLMPLINDFSDVDIRILALGTLRNLSIVSSSACQMMIDEDGMMAFLLQQLTFSSCSDEEDVKMKVVSIKLETLCLLNNLCGSCEAAVDFINKEDILKILFPLLLPPFDQKMSLAVAAAELLYTLSEENKGLASELSYPEYFSKLVFILSSSSLSSFEASKQLFIKVLISGVTCNVMKDKNKCVDWQLMMNTVVKLFIDVLDSDIKLTLKKISQEIKKQAVGNTAETLDRDVTEVKHAELESKVDEMKYLLNCQQVALETIANIFSSNDDDEDDEWKDCDMSSDDVDDEMETTTQVVHVDVTTMECDNRSSVLTDLKSAFVSSGLIEKVFDIRINSEDLEACRDLESQRLGKILINSLSNTLRVALGCANNLVVIVEEMEIEGRDNTMNGLYNRLREMIVNWKDSDKLDILGEMTSTLNAVIRNLIQLNSEQVATDIQSSDLTMLFEIVKRCKDESSIRVNIIRIVNAIGCCLARQMQSVAPQSLLLMIAEFLFLILTIDADVWVSAEALDAIFDVFAEDETDSILIEFKMIEKLKQILPTLKLKLRSVKKGAKKSENQLVINTVRDNLSRFINYKFSRLNRR